MPKIKKKYPTRLTRKRDQIILSSVLSFLITIFILGGFNFQWWVPLVSIGMGVVFFRLFKKFGKYIRLDGESTLNRCHGVDPANPFFDNVGWANMASRRYTRDW